MPFCSHCGQPLHPAAAFCARCGGATGVRPPHAPPAQNAPPSPGGGLASAQHHFERFLADIRSFNFKWIVPIDTALSPQLLQNRTVWIMLIFGFYPLLAAQFNLIHRQEDAILPLGIYCALAWSGYFYYFVCKRSVDFRTGAAVTAFTAIVGIRLALLLWTVPPFSNLQDLKGDDSDAIAHFVGFTLGTGVIEEFCKALPVLLLAYAMRVIEKPLDGIFFGAMSGLGFGITEGSSYIQMGGGNVVMVLLRTTTLPFMHALWAATVGYFIGLAQINRSRGAALVLIGYAVAVVGHGTYDTFANGPLGLALAALSYLLFAAYLERSQQMVSELQRAERQVARNDALQKIFSQTYVPQMQVGTAPPPRVPPGQGTA